MNKKILSLQQQLKEAQQEDLKQQWEAYLDKAKLFCQQLVGRVLIQQSTCQNLRMLKAIGFAENYYADVSGFHGQFGPERWLELETEGYFSFRNQAPDNKGNWRATSLDHLDETAYAHRFVFKKGSRIEIAKLDFSKLDLDGNGPFQKHTIKFGYTEYKEYRHNPNLDRALTDFCMHTRVMPDDSVYNQAVRLYLKQIEDLKNFWQDNSHKFDNLMPVDNL